MPSGTWPLSRLPFYDGGNALDVGGSLSRGSLELAERRQAAPEPGSSSCRTRSRVRSSSWPIASSVQGSPSKPKRSSRIRRSRSGSASSARRTPWRRSDSSASSNGSAASRSAKRSPSSPSSSAPTVWFSETDACAAPSASSTCWIGRPGRLGELLLRRLAAELDLEPARGAAELLLPLDDVDRHADRARVVRDGALHRLADPPGRVRRELVAAAPVELLDGAVQAERALLDQVEEGDAEPAVALGDRDDEPQVRLDHAALGGQVAALDRLRERDLVGGGQQLVAADVGQEELQAVGRADERVGSVGGDGLLRLRGSVGLAASGSRISRPVASSSRRSCLDLVLGELVLERERLELGRLDEAALLRAVEQQAGVLGLEQLVQLALGQFRPLRLRSSAAVSIFRTVGGFSSLD